MDVAQTVVRYIKDQPGRVLLLSSKPQNTVTTFCDVDWATCPQTRRSVTGFLVKVSESMMSWKF